VQEALHAVNAGNFGPAADFHVIDTQEAVQLRPVTAGTGGALFYEKDVRNDKRRIQQADRGRSFVS
jgi:hypothetical protein